VWRNLPFGSGGSEQLVFVTGLKISAELRSPRPSFHPPDIKITLVVVVVVGVVEVVVIS